MITMDGNIIHWTWKMFVRVSETIMDQTNTPNSNSNKENNDKKRIKAQ